MIWIVLLAMAAAAFLVVWRFAALDRGGAQLLAAGLLLALAGYAWQGSPGLEGSPRTAAERPPLPKTAFMVLRRDLFGQFDAADRWLIMSEAAATRGDTADAAAFIHSALRRYPRSTALWTGYGDALALHGNGLLAPAADYAYRRAIAEAPQHPGPFIFYGIALAQNGRLDEAERSWLRALALTPPTAPWRDGLLLQIEQLRAAKAAGAGPR